VKLGKSEEQECVGWQLRIGVLKGPLFIDSIPPLRRWRNGIEVGGGEPRDLDLRSVGGRSKWLRVMEMFGRSVFGVLIFEYLLYQEINCPHLTLLISSTLLSV
jgi:hypothetical protein